MNKYIFIPDISVSKEKNRILTKTNYIGSKTFDLCQDPFLP